MNEYITDSIYFKKKSKDFFFYPNEIFKWKIADGHEGLEYIKTGKFKGGSSITGVVSSTNYRLLHDILYIDKNPNLYNPEYNKDGFYKKYTIDSIEINNQFDNYMKRSYLSYLSYVSLKNIGLKRIEQFLILLSGILFSNKKIYDNLFITSFTIKKVIYEKKQIYKKDSKLNLINFIHAIQNKLNYEFLDIFSYILKLYSELKCSDPFSPEGIEFFEDDNEMYDAYYEISENEVYINRILLTSDKKQKIVVNKPVEEYSSLIMDYYLLQKEDYFEDKILISKIDAPSIIEVISYLNNIIPLKDIFLSIQLLNKMKKIDLDNLHIGISSSLKSRLNIKDNKKWITLDLWKDIYNNTDYIFNQIIEPIEIDKISFVCPLCDNNVYSITPEKLFCSKLGCNFTFHRSNLKKLGIKRISLENIIESIKNKSILIQKDSKDGNIPLFLKENDGFYSLWIK